MSFSTPVLLIAFNRPESTARVLRSLAEIKPQKLYVACDGPRFGRPEEARRCEAVRALVSQMDWPCDVQTLFQPSNLGCRAGVTAALDWFFEQEEEGIVLEDDIVADPSFFPFCQELLERYRHDERVGVIAANNHQRLPPSDGSSYRFSIYSHCWGWASWRRAWRCNDPELRGWPAFRDGQWLEQLGGKSLARRWGPWLDQLSAGQIDTWDMIWQFSCWQQGFLTVIPAVELVENIGFGVDATHTLDERSPLGTPGSLRFPLRHPTVMQADRLRDQDTFRRLFQRRRRADWLRKGRKALRLLGWRS
ncbi:glycosyltransferase family 2 protein [Vulcanococcus sp.]|uniref:glycosyltransferase family 2 protein n=1 Tax=Vulcanococcus sp. TaxID=2856995 RepID=UPI003C001988